MHLYDRGQFPFSLSVAKNGMLKSRQDRAVCQRQAFLFFSCKQMGSKTKRWGEHFFVLGGWGMLGTSESFSLRH